VEEKSNEITAIPKLLKVLAIKGCTVTIDAMGCQREIAAEIIDKEADYILAVKGNQGNLERNAEETIRFTKAAEEWIEEDVGHGRIESRTCSVYRDLSFIENASMWKGLKGVVKIESTRYIKSTGKEERETRLYITSSQACVQVIGKGIRSHWGIENKLHWQLMSLSRRINLASEMAMRLRIFPCLTGSHSI
jgi:predicted transposase YbfD/YdcC